MCVCVLYSIAGGSSLVFVARFYVINEVSMIEALRYHRIASPARTTHVFSYSGARGWQQAVDEEKKSKEGAEWALSDDRGSQHGDGSHGDAVWTG